MDNIVPSPCGGQLPAAPIYVQPGEGAAALFLNAMPTSQLIPDFGNCIESAKSLVQMAGLPLEVARHLAYSNTPCYAIVDPIPKTVCRIMVLFHGLLRNGAQTPFFLSSETLRNMVMHIDCLPKTLGHLYGKRLQQECETLLPTPIAESSFLDDVARPLQIFSVNRGNFQCGLLDVALVICAMFRLVRLDSRLAFADWTPFIAAVQYAPVASLPLAMAQATQKML